MICPACANNRSVLTDSGERPCYLCIKNGPQLDPPTSRSQLLLISVTITLCSVILSVSSMFIVDSLNRREAKWEELNRRAFILSQDAKRLEIQIRALKSQRSCK